MSGPCPAWLRIKTKRSLVNHAAKHCQFMRQDWMNFEVRFFFGSSCCDGRKIASQKKKKKKQLAKDCMAMITWEVSCQRWSFEQMGYHFVI